MVRRSLRLAEVTADPFSYVGVPSETFFGRVCITCAAYGMRGMFLWQLASVEARRCSGVLRHGLGCSFESGCVGVSFFASIDRANLVVADQ